MHLDIGDKLVEVGAVDQRKISASG